MPVTNRFIQDYGAGLREKRKVAAKDVKHFISLWEKIKEMTGGHRKAIKALHISGGTIGKMKNDNILTKDMGKKILDGYNKLKSK